MRVNELFPDTRRMLTETYKTYLQTRSKAAASHGTEEKQLNKNVDGLISLFPAPFNIESRVQQLSIRNTSDAKAWHFELYDICCLSVMIISLSEVQPYSRSSPKPN